MKPRDVSRTHGTDPGIVDKSRKPSSHIIMLWWIAKCHDEHLHRIWCCPALQLVYLWVGTETHTYIHSLVRKAVQRKWPLTRIITSERAHRQVTGLIGLHGMIPIHISLTVLKFLLFFLFHHVCTSIQHCIFIRDFICIPSISFVLFSIEVLQLLLLIADSFFHALHFAFIWTSSFNLTIQQMCVCLQAHASCYIMIPLECGLGRLRNMILHPSCVRVCSRNFSKMHCYRISEPLQQCELGNQPAEPALIETWRLDSKPVCTALLPSLWGNTL